MEATVYLSSVAHRSGRRYLVYDKPLTPSDDTKLNVVIQSSKGKTLRIYPVFQQKAGDYESYSEYMKMHGCACCTLTTLLAAYVPDYADLRPERTAAEVEREHIPESVWRANYEKPLKKQMPVSLFGISKILQDFAVSNRYIPVFEDKQAVRAIRQHLFRGKPVVIETSCIKRRRGWAVPLKDTRFAGSYHTMILLGVDRDGQVIFTDSATRDWSGEYQRLKRARVSELVPYMFSQKNEGNTDMYFSKRRNTGGYILLDA